MQAKPLVQFSIASLIIATLIGCGGSNESETTTPPDVGTQEPIHLSAQNSFSVFPVNQRAVVSLKGRVHSSDSSAELALTEVRAIDHNQNCVIDSVNKDNFVVSANEPSACHFEYSVSANGNEGSQAQAISQVVFEPTSVDISPTEVHLAPVAASLEQGQCQSLDVSANIPANASLDNSVVVIGSGSGVVEDVELGLINYCAGDQGNNDIVYTASNADNGIVYTGSIAVSVSVESNHTPQAHSFSYYYDPANETVKIPSGEEVVIDVADFVDDLDSEDHIQLIEVQAANSTAFLTDADDMTSSSFTFKSDLAGTYFVNYHITDHHGGHSVGVVKLSVDSPFDDYYVDTGDVDTSFTLTAPITLAEINQYGMSYLGQTTESTYEMATFNHQLAKAICKARGGVLAEQSDFALALGTSTDVTQTMGWPASETYIVDFLNPNGNGDDTVAAWNNDTGEFIEQGAISDQGYFSCKNIKARDFKIRDPFYVIAGTIKDLVATYTNSAGAGQFYIRGIDWTSSDPSILEIDRTTGRAEGMKKGTVTVTARTIDGELIDAIDVDVIDEIPVFGMGSLNNQNENGFNLAVEESNSGYAIAANAILRDTQNFGTSGATVKLKASWNFETANDYQYSQLRDALKRDYPPAVVQIGYPNQPDAVTTNALRDFLYNGGVLMYFSQDRDPTNNIMRAIFGSEANAGTFTGSGGVFKFSDIDDPIINGPFGDLRNQYWGLDQSQVAYAYDLPEGTYVPFSFSYDESRGWDAGGSIKRTGVTSLRHKTLKFVWTGDAGFFGYHTNNPSWSEARTDAFPLMVADYNQDFSQGDYRPVSKANYGSNTRFDVSNSIFYANAVTWLFGAAPSTTQ